VGGLQLRGATEWMDPEHLFSSGVVALRTAPPARTSSRPRHPAPSPVGSHPVSRGGRAPFDRGDPLRAVMPKFISARRRALFGQGIAVRGRNDRRRRGDPTNRGPPSRSRTKPGVMPL
jgi:hypothetical protein